ncbi:MAG: ketoacyl-ACP synthase III, partial [Bdellovibrionales bacterium]|nr:ketoacyl-ACP synthase III [Bdellovibrionales bacterium]
MSYGTENSFNDSLDLDYYLHRDDMKNFADSASRELEESHVCSRILGTGSALPERCISNDELSQHMDTTNEWIHERVGIRQRYVCTGAEGTTSLAVLAAERALEQAKLTGDDIDIVIVGTFTPDNTLPSTAALVAEKLNIRNAITFDLQAACSGFLFGYVTAESLLSSLNKKNALVIGSDTLSRVVDWKDRNTAVLFGDGAGACVLQRPSQDASPSVIASYVRTLAEGASLITCDRPIELNSSSFFEIPDGNGYNPDPYLRMKGSSVFRSGVQLMASSIFEVLSASGLQVSDVNLFVPHQSNLRMIQSVAEIVGITDPDVIATTLDTAGNTSAASIPITLDHYHRSGRIRI